MNYIHLSLRAANDPRIYNEKDGVPIFATVFALHSDPDAKVKDRAIPITVKASLELASTLVQEVKKGTAFIVEGELAYFKNTDTNKESYSIRAESLTGITQPKSKTSTPDESYE